MPDYNGCGWHVSRKKVMKQLGGIKRSYYMDPQPSNQFGWHLYEYEMNNYDACALYWLELKQVDSKKNTKEKVMGDSGFDLQHKIGRLSAELAVDTKGSTKGRTNLKHKNFSKYTYSAASPASPVSNNFLYGQDIQYGYYAVESNGYYGT